MANSLFQSLSPSSQNNGISQIKNIMQLMRGNANPNQVLQMAAQTNPQLKQVMDMVQQSGKSPKDLFYEMAKQKGINPDDILNQLK